MAKILLIDDDPTQRVVAAFALRKAGHETREADDGEAGLALVRELKPDLVVCDVVMPKVNGYQFVSNLRQQVGIADTPVIMLTSMAERTHMRMGMTAGADDYLAKPFSTSELCDAVSALLSKRKVQRAEIVNSVKDDFMAALDEQKQSLAQQYERRLIDELDSRWDRESETNTELKYDDAVVLVVDLFGPLLAGQPAGDLAGLVRRKYQAARDTLFLFDARHLLPSGNDLVAVFAARPDAVGTPPEVRALRAALALVKTAAMEAETARDQRSVSAPPGPDIAIGLHQGPVTLLRVNDPLHGGAASMLAAGETFAEAAALRGLALESGWQIACSRPLAESLKQFAVIGRSGHVASERAVVLVDAVELLAPP